MKIERHILRDELEENTLRKNLLAKLPKNAMVLNENAQFVKQYTSFCSIESELKYLNEVIEKLSDIRIEEKKDQNIGKNDYQLVVKKSLFIASIISYGRCFNSTSKDGRISIDENFIKKGFPNHPDLSLGKTLKFHSKLLRLRNKFVAHADKSEFAQTLSFIEFSYQDKRLNSEFSYISGNIYSFDETELINFIILVAYLLKKTNEKIKVLSDKIVSKLTETGLVHLGMETLKKSNGSTS